MCIRRGKIHRFASEHKTFLNVMPRLKKCEPDASWDKPGMHGFFNVSALVKSDLFICNY